MSYVSAIATTSGNILYAPFAAASWIGAKATDWGFDQFDKTPLGIYIQNRCYRIGGTSFVVGDAGYIGFALEQGSGLQMSGALITLPAHALLTLFGDKSPLILQMLDRITPVNANSRTAKIVAGMKYAGKYLVEKTHYIIPAAFSLLAYNGFSIAAGVVTKPARNTFPTFMQHIPVLSQSPIAIHALDILLKSPQFMQGATILVGCGGIAVTEYLNRTNKEVFGYDEQARKERKAYADRWGNFSVGILSSCTLLTTVTAVVNLSPSLALSTAAFFVGNYCYRHIARATQTKVTAPAP